MLSNCISINLNKGLSIKIFKELNTLIFKFTYNIYFISKTTPNGIC